MHPGPPQAQAKATARARRERAIRSSDPPPRTDPGPPPRTPTTPHQPNGSEEIKAASAPNGPSVVPAYKSPAWEKPHSFQRFLITLLIFISPFPRRLRFSDPTPPPPSPIESRRILRPIRPPAPSPPRRWRSGPIAASPWRSGGSGFADGSLRFRPRLLGWSGGNLVRGAGRSSSPAGRFYEGGRWGCCSWSRSRGPRCSSASTAGWTRRRRPPSCPRSSAAAAAAPISSTACELGLSLNLYSPHFDL